LFNSGTFGVAPRDAGVASGAINTGQQLGGSIGIWLVNTIFASSITGYIATHASPATLVNGRPSPQLTALAQIHGYVTAFRWSAAILGVAAIAALILFPSGPLAKTRTDSRPTEPTRPLPAAATVN
jgi:hypothetical protein